MKTCSCRALLSATAAPLPEEVIGEAMLAVGLRKAIEANEAADTTAKSEEAVPCIREWLLSRVCHPLILFHLFSY